LVVDAQIAAVVVDVPDPVVRRDADAPAVRALPRHLDQLQLHRLRVDRRELVRTHQVDPRPALRVDGDAVRPRPLDRHGDQLHLARGDGELADVVAALRGEPDVALLVEDQRVRVPHARVRHGELRDLTGRGVQLADVCGAVAGVPDRAVRGDDQVVRVDALIDLVALERARSWIQVRDVVAGLAHEPDEAVRGHVRIARPGPLPGYGPLLHLDRLVLGEEMSGQAAQEHGREQQQGCEPSHGLASGRRVWNAVARMEGARQSPPAAPPWPANPGTLPGTAQHREREDAFQPGTREAAGALS